MIPVTPTNMVGQEVWARMPGRPGEPMGVESNVELMGFVLSEYWLANQKAWKCKAFESHGVWTSHPEEEVLNIKSIRLPLSNGAQFKYQQQVSVRPATDHWVVNGNIVPKTGRIEAGWCERSPSSNGSRLKYSYWVRCELPGVPASSKWYQQEDLEYTLPVAQGIPRSPVWSWLAPALSHVPTTRNLLSLLSLLRDCNRDRLSSASRLNRYQNVFTNPLHPLGMYTAFPT
ncbi:hypothetical protein RSOLAG1IB_09608 [Rhizoctonia solani AG-1 IB]|uniref:Uncharacterized protein n=1 Tax=Thanatephorus cucumeris (strain AG1-IB / isolate 7/3/14) TaxID=1108050 RepID=A0A0B7FRS3_THACB|nr:hypothetical protein RSOLAG1IB_09608 [Rhizoctonia solani AG-1 IB]